jgi:hypothetical protein
MIILRYSNPAHNQENPISREEIMEALSEIRRGKDLPHDDQMRSQPRGGLGMRQDKPVDAGWGARGGDGESRSAPNEKADEIGWGANASDDKKGDSWGEQDQTRQDDSWGNDGMGGATGGFGGAGAGAGDDDCRNCLKPGHFVSPLLILSVHTANGVQSRECPNPEVCRRCKKEGHRVSFS